MTYSILWVTGIVVGLIVALLRSTFEALPLLMAIALSACIYINYIQEV